MVFSKEDLLKDLEKVSKKFFKENVATKFVTRDYYRKHGSHSENRIKRIFKNFKEFSSNVENDGANITYRRKDFDIQKKANKVKSQKYFVMAVVAGQSLEDTYMESVDTYCKKNNAQLLMLVMRGEKVSYQLSKEIIDKYSKNLVTEFTFNNNLKAMDFYLAPQQIQPLTGLNRYGQKEYSLIVAHTKQDLNSVPTSSSSHPHIVCSTGCCTKAKYTNSHRIGGLAYQDHLVGGLIVEIVNSNKFHIRQIQADEFGGFNDYDTYYKENTVKKSSPEAITLGDTHIGDECPIAMKAVSKLIKETGVKNIYFNDLIDFSSCSHHQEHDLHAKVTRKDHQSTIEKELKYAGNFLKEFCEKDLNYYVIRSNHDDFLLRYLSESRYYNDGINAKIGSLLQMYLLHDKNPIEEYLKKDLNLDKDINLNFLDITDSKKHGGIEHAKHGHRGNNGARGSAKSLEVSFPYSNIAHSHTPQIFRSVYQAGTLSSLSPAYTKGSPSGWMHSSIITFPNGNRQLITIIDGEYKL